MRKHIDKKTADELLKIADILDGGSSGTKMKVIGDVEIAKTNYLVLKDRLYVNRNGEVTNWNMVSRVGGANAVVIVAYKESTADEGRKLVVIREFRVPLNDYEWGFPAGLKYDGESVEDAVRRELKEETGLDVKQILAISPFVYNSAGLTDEAVAMAFVEVEGEISDTALEASEDIETCFMGVVAVANLLVDGRGKFGAKAWLVMDRFARTGEIM